MHIRVLALAALMAACASAPSVPAPDPMHMDEETFRRELAERFQYPPPQPAPATVDDQAAGQIADAAYLTAYPQYERAFNDNERAEAVRLVQRLQADAGSVTHEQFVLRVAAIAALADNGHSAIGRNAFMKNTPRIPVRTYLFADGLYVLYADEADQDLLGARVDTIDGRSIESVFRVIRRYRGGTDPTRRGVLIPMLESPALLQAAGVAQARDALTLNGVLANGARFERRIAAEDRDAAAWVSSTSRLTFPDRLANVGMSSFLHDAPTLPASLHGGDHVFWSEALAEGGYYIRLDHNNDADEGPIAPFLDAQLAHLRAEHPVFVVLDMRLNGGGDYTTTYAFAHDLPAAAGEAPIYVLTSSWTFSAAITTVAGLKEAGGARVTLVGEEVGDRLDFWAEGGVFVLPNTALVVSYTTGRHIYNGRCADTNTCFWLNYLYPVRVRSLAPDISVPQTFAAYRDGRDGALDAVFAREARRRLSAHTR
jgi:hypothetical protein